MARAWRRAHSRGRTHVHACKGRRPTGWTPRERVDKMSGLDNSDVTQNPMLDLVDTSSPTEEEGARAAALGDNKGKAAYVAPKVAVSAVWLVRKRKF